MAKRNLLAFDLGASNGRAILGRFDGERLEMEELHRFETPSTDLNGVLYWDAPAIFTHMKGALAKFAALDQGPLQGLGIDTWGVDYGLLDKNGNLLGLPRCYRDATDQDVEAVHRIVPQRTLFQRTGINAMNYNTAYQLYRRKREGDGALSAAKTLLFMPDLLGYFLTGEKATEYTIATTSMLYDGSRRDWDRETLAQLGLPDVFTPIQQSGAQRGLCCPRSAGKPASIPPCCARWEATIPPRRWRQFPARGISPSAPAAPGPCSGWRPTPRCWTRPPMWGASPTRAPCRGASGPSRASWAFG